MSFMFKPLDYDDQTAINRPQLDESLVDDLTFGTVASGKRIAADLAARAASGERGVTAAFDGYASASFSDLVGAVAQELLQLGVPVIQHSMSEVYKPVEELDQMVADSLPQDFKLDPVLLFGRLYEGDIADFIDPVRGASLLRAWRMFPRERCCC